MKTKTILITLTIILAIGYGFFSYYTRPLPVMTININDQVEHLADTQTNTENSKVLNIVNTQSEASFSLNEVLNGKPTLVVGTTNQVAGDIKVIETPATISFGEVKVDARTLKTDNEKRNGAIGRMILKSEETGNEYIVFKTTSVIGLPAIFEKGREFNYKIIGDLTIRGVTKSVSFDAKSTLNNDGTLKVSASTMVTYGDYGISVPSFPFLANVDKTTKLSISLIAK